jgi:hypothetical protein
MRPEQNREAVVEAQVEQLLRGVAADSDLLSEAPDDLIARALKRVPRRPSALLTLPRGAFAAMGAATACGLVAWGAVGHAGSGVRGKHLMVDSLVAPRLCAPSLVPEEESMVTRNTLSKKKRGMEFQTPLSRNGGGAGGQLPHRVDATLLASLPHHIYRHHKSHPARPVAPSRLAALPGKTVPSIAPPQRVATRQKPFWHDEQVERDDYTVVAPALLAEGTGQEVTSIQPALVQISYSTSHFVRADNVTSDTNYR